MDRRVRRLLAVGLCGFLVAAGCSQSFVPGNSSSDDDSNDPGTTSQRQYVMVPAGPKDLNVGVGKSAPLKVFLYEKKSGDAVTDATVEFGLAEGAERASLGAGSATTNDNGAASVEFRAGDVPGSTEVVATHSAANDVSFSVQVDPVPSGGLEVELVNTGSSVMPLTDVGVRVYSSEEMTCREFRPLAADQPDSLRAKSKSEAGTTVRFGDLSVAESYTVTATARGDRGQLAAGGCLSDVQIPEQKVVEKELLLHLVDLDPSGRYRATTMYDFSKAIRESGPIGEQVIEILDIFENPADELYSKIVDLIKGAVGDLAGKGIEWVLDQTGLDEEFKNLIKGAIENNETLCKIQQTGLDLRAMVTNVRVDSELTIGTLRSDYEFRGRNNWTSLTVYWRGKCEDSLDDVCSGDNAGTGKTVDRMQPCAAVRLTPDQGEKVESLGVWSSEWKGRVMNHNKLEIDRHPVPLRYGRLLSYLLDHVILPDLTDGNANSLEGAFAYWLGCGSLGTSVTGSDGEVCTPDPVDVCLTADQISGFCESAVSTVFGAAGFLISELKFDTGIYVGGEGDLVETTSDGRVDYIENGSYDGYIEVSRKGVAESRATITGQWDAERISEDRVRDSN